MVQGEGAVWSSQSPSLGGGSRPVPLALEPPCPPAARAFEDFLHAMQSGSGIRAEFHMVEADPVGRCRGFYRRLGSACHGDFRIVDDPKSAPAGAEPDGARAIHRAVSLLREVSASRGNGATLTALADRAIAYGAGA